eukprot:CAMPEP_0171759158 /NCGR_PEP_ID=MMETSP0991-20121206/46707_1 /TAXON_ID=483369 /ORGANISM="non described non described, Strain CCMP2098" /LENGTH=44 /DNA_ID= /DNA_START= /DNA_END= /DNA_ORIENTATION=
MTPGLRATDSAPVVETLHAPQHLLKHQVVVVAAAANATAAAAAA